MLTLLKIEESEIPGIYNIQTNIHKTKDLGSIEIDSTKGVRFNMFTEEIYPFGSLDGYDILLTQIREFIDNHKFKHKIPIYYDNIHYIRVDFSYCDDDKILSLSVELLKYLGYAITLKNRILR